MAVVPTRVYLEVGQQRTFACVLDWPGWCRSGKGDEAALEALAEYLPRYRPVAREAKVRMPAGVAESFEVVERLPGNMTTDFGAPGLVPAVDAEPLTPREAARHAALVRASWTILDRVAAGAPAELRKGPRGGGRDRDKMVAHVVAAEASYARKIGVRVKGEEPDAVAARRASILETITTGDRGAPVVPKGWPLRYAARRIAWHVLDHAWEMQDKS